MTGPMTDIITGNPMVVKMIVSFNRFTSTLSSAHLLTHLLSFNLEYIFLIRFYRS